MVRKRVTADIVTHQLQDVIRQRLADNFLDPAEPEGAAWVAASATPDATSAVKGKLQLAGDLGGTAAAPTVPSLTTKAPLNSPAFTGNPTAPTPAAGDNDTSIATTAFVQNEITTIALVEDPADEGTYLIGGA